MTDQSEAKDRLESLELNKETIQDLTEQEGEDAKGGGFSGSACGCPAAGDQFTFGCGGCSA